MVDRCTEPVPSPREDLLLSGIADRALVLDRAGARAHVLNASAAWIWDLIDGVRAPDDIVAVIATTTGADPAVIRVDVDAVVEQFRSSGLLGVAPPPVPGDPPVPPGPSSRGSGAGALDPPRLPYGVGPFSSIGFTVVVGTDDAAIAAELDHLLGPLAGDREPEATYVVTEADGDGDGDGFRYRARLGSDPVAAGDDVRSIVDGVLIDLNRRAIERARGWLLFHAGAVEVDGAVVALPAVSGSGKSTLTAALVATGAGYLSDEAAVIDPATFLVQPYPKPLALSHASIGAIRRSDATAGAPVAGWSPAMAPPAVPMVKAHVAASALGRVCVAGVPLGALVFPTYEPDAAAELVRLDVVEALVALIPCTFAATWTVPDGLDRVIDLVESVPAFRLTFSDLDTATTLIRETRTTGAPR